MLTLSRSHGGTHTVIVKRGVVTIQRGTAVFEAIADQAGVVLFSGKLGGPMPLNMRFIGLGLGIIAYLFVSYTLPLVAGA